MAYAENTEVAVEKSIGEIVTLVKKAGAQRIAQAETPEGLAIQFFLAGRMIRFRVNMPPIADMPTRDGRGAALTAKAREAKLAQRHRQRARGLLLVIKAKLESVASGIETLDEAFLANVVMLDGKTVMEHALPSIESSYRDGKQPMLLLPSF